MRVPAVFRRGGWGVVGAVLCVLAAGRFVAGQYGVPVPIPAPVGVPAPAPPAPAAPPAPLASAPGLPTIPIPTPDLPPIPVVPVEVPAVPVVVVPPVPPGPVSPAGQPSAPVAPAASFHEPPVAHPVPAGHAQPPAPGPGPLPVYTPAVPPLPPESLPAPQPFPPAADAGPTREEKPGPTADKEAIRSVVTDLLKEREEKQRAEEEKKRKEAEAKGHEVGSDLGLRGVWDNGLVFQTANKDWRVHIGGRLQFYPVFWAQPQSLRGGAPGSGGVPGAGVGEGVGLLDDGMFFRRVRFRADGAGYELVEFVLEVNFEQLNFITFDHMWFGFKDLPFLGTVRIGQHKVPQGMEMIGSDYHLTFLERSSLSDAIWTLFAPGVFVANNFLDDNVSFQTMFHRLQPTQFYTSDFGNGDYASTTRLTWTPVYKDEGANLVHVGGSYQWRHADLGRTIQPGGTGNAFADTQHVARFRARPELRDATGIGTTLGGDTARFVDTGFLLASNVHTISPEFLLIAGPFSVQAEAAWSYVQDARQIYPAAAFGTPRGTPMFWGGYIETSYFLTGEHRGYDRRFGMYDRPKVRENFFLVRGEDGRFHMGLGAWQVAYRYSYLDLNDNGINGGQLGQHTLGLNWYFNDNAKLQFQYSHIHRNVAAPSVSGTVHGFGMLAQWYF
jgi:phosphate-selective porin OprO/OprP